jgi:uncharacterized phage-associated protein
MFTVHHISSYFLSLSAPESGEGMSHLKLQKLCYYAQGFYLAQYDKPLFSEVIEAWQHGPVVPDLYQEYKTMGYNFIPPPKINIDIYPSDIVEFLDEVYEVYGQFSAWKLRDMTHMESPWIEAFNNQNNNVITHDSMKNYFKTLLQPTVE